MKYIIDLEIEDDWPPVAAESLWFDRVRGGYQLKSVPLFVPDVAYDDIVHLDLKEDERAIICSVIKRSGNSTVWLYLSQGVDEKSALERVSKLGVGFEGGDIVGLFALNLPLEIKFTDLKNSLDYLLKRELAELALGSMQHSI